MMGPTASLIALRSIVLHSLRLHEYDVHDISKFLLPSLNLRVGTLKCILFKHIQVSYFLNNEQKCRYRTAGLSNRRTIATHQIKISLLNGRNHQAKA